MGTKLKKPVFLGKMSPFKPTFPIFSRFQIIFITSTLTSD